MSEPWYRWPKGLREHILSRDGYHCVIQIPNVCRHTTTPHAPCATVIDHIIPVLAGGAWFSEHNLRAACRPCNNYRKRWSGPRPQGAPKPHPEHW